MISIVDTGQWIQLVAALLAGIGLFSILAKNNLLRVVIGLQTLFLAVNILLVFSGRDAESEQNASVLCLFIILSGILHLVLGSILCLRLFASKANVDMSEISKLKN